jgi:hypothetical protein
MIFQTPVEKILCAIRRKSIFWMPNTEKIEFPNLLHNSYCIIVLMIIQYGVGIGSKITVNVDIKCDVKNESQYIQVL